MPDLPPRTRKKCLKLLHRICGRHALLPRTLEIPVCYDRTGVALCSGRFADVWKGEYCGLDVAVKALRTYSNGDLQKIIGVGRGSYFLSTCRCADQVLHRFSAGRSWRGKSFDTQTYYR